MIPRGIALRTSKEKVPEIVINLIIPILSTSSVDAQHQHYSSCIKEIHQTKSIHNYYYYYVLNFILIFTRQKYKKLHVFEVWDSLKELLLLQYFLTTINYQVVKDVLSLPLIMLIRNKKSKDPSFMKGTKDIPQ